MAQKNYQRRFPIRKLNRKKIFKRMQQISHRPRSAGRGSTGISRRKP